MKYATHTDSRSAAPAAGNAGSRIEYRSATGPLLAPGISLCDDATLIHGDGRIEFRRRGDLGEREDFPPGSWSAACEPSQVEKLWEALRDLGPGSFPSRAADPGDTVRDLTAYAAGQVHTLTIGPTDPSQPAPGDAFMQALYPILRLRQAGECHWALLATVAGLVRVQGGAEAEIRFRNPGTRVIGLVFDGEPGASDFHIRFAQDREEIPYPEWHHADNPPAGPDQVRLLSLEPGAEIVRKVFFPCSFPDRGKYMGKIAYRQTRHLDALAGVPVLAGIAYTEMAEFTV